VKKARSAFFTLHLLPCAAEPREQQAGMLSITDKKNALSIATQGGLNNCLY